MTQLLVQEQHLPGATLERKWEAAQEFGYDGIELRAQGELAFAARLPDLRRAEAAGVPMPTVCVDMLHFIGDFDAELRRDARRQLASQLSAIAEIGGVGAITPASYGMFSRRLPPYDPPRPPSEDRQILLDALGELGRHAAAEGVRLFFEPLNRYEDHMVNTLAEGVSLLREVGLDSVRLCTDSYHQQIEEADAAAAMLAAGPWVGHVQASDSNRLEPGAGSIDWPLFGATLAAIGYDGTVAVESRLSGPAEEVLPRASALLRRFR